MPVPTTQESKKLMVVLYKEHIVLTDIKHLTSVNAASYIEKHKLLIHKSARVRHASMKKLGLI